MPDETPLPVELPFQPSLTLPGATGTPFPPADAPAPPWKMLPTSPSPAGDRWMNIFHGDETWQGRWPAENDQLLSMMDDPAELKMASANALWIAERLGESHDAVTRAYPMALGLTSLQLLGHMDGTDRDVYDAIGNDLLPRIDESQLQASLQHPLAGIEQPVHELVTLGNWVPELDEARAYSSYGGKVAHVSFAGKGGVIFVPSTAQSEQLGRDVYVPTSRQPVEPGGKGIGHTALNIVKSVAGGLSEGTLSMIGGAGFLADKTLEYLPGYRDSTADTWMNATVEGFESQRRLMKEFYAVDPEFAESYVGKISSAVGSTVPQLVSFVVPPLAVAGVAGQSFLYAYEDARNTAARLGQPFDPDRAYAYAATMAVANTALTFVKFNVAARPWLKPQAGTLTNTLLKVFKTSVAFGGVGAFQGGVNDFVATAFDIEKRNPADIGRRWNDFVVGAGTGAVLGLGGLAVTRAPEKPPQPPPEKPGVTFDKSLGKQEVPQPAPDSAGSIKKINFSGGKENCVNCAIAVDRVLAGAKNVVAAPGRQTPIAFLEKIYKTKFFEVAGRSEIDRVLKDMGPGARGIVFAYNPNAKVGHVWNVANQKNVVHYLDGQTGGDGSRNFLFFKRFELIITNKNDNLR